jgi:hypothetical protein
MVLEYIIQNVENGLHVIDAAVLEKYHNGWKTMIDGKVCEFCLDGEVLDSLWGRFRLYECEKGVDYMQKYLGAFPDPCEGFHCGTGKRGETWKPKYKRIDMSKMRKSKSCIKQEKEDKEKRQKEAEVLRNKAIDLLRNADELER